VSGTTVAYQDPNNWQTLNFLFQFGNPVSAFRVTGGDKYAGNYALKVVSTYFPNKLIATFPDTFGFAYNGKVVVSPPSLTNGAAYNLRPQRISFYTKYIPVGLDTGLVTVGLFRHIPTGRDTIAYNKIKILPNSVYSLYDIPLNYLNNNIPDTADISFKSSNPDLLARRVGSAIYVDEVSFNGFVNIKENNNYASKIKIYPIPATNEVMINAEFDEAETIEVIDINGKTVGKYKIQNYFSKINTHTFANGNYFIKFLNKQNLIITYGNFLINK